MAGPSAAELVEMADERNARALELQRARWDELEERNAITEAEARPAILPPQIGQTEFVERMLSGSQAKTAFALRLNAEEMIKGALKSTGFLTLTVGDKMGDEFVQVFDASEASRRINNLNRRILPYLFERAIIVT
ncbi:MAG TPA: hypothetical protein VFC07_08880, partial [Verrucomicrobiae bacterium]|nr:hypothetical protein [Verrucomicrobiae bacterium]